MHPPRRVVIVGYEAAELLDIACVSTTLDTANRIGADPAYEVVLATPGGRAITCDSGLTLVAQEALERVRGQLDTLLVSGGYGHEAAAADPWLVDQVRRLARTSRRVASVCTGASVLAAAGLLDGRRATTHWEYAEEFRRLFPAVELDPDVLFVDEGDVLTSAGLGAGVDLCLHLIRRDYGVEAANHAARGCVVPPWREGGQAQFIEHPVPQSSQSTSATRVWARANLRTVTRVEQLVAHARMSERTLSRRFRAETGLSPQQWLLQARLQRALELLERTDLPVDRVAEEAGFGTGAALRHRMRTALSTTPQAYRRTFAGPAVGHTA